MNRRMLIVTLAAVLFCTIIERDAAAKPFEVGEFTTYSQDSYGSLGEAGSQLLFSHFDELYPNGAEMGLPGLLGNSALFTTVQAVLEYLPASGSAGPLNNDYLDPTSTSAGFSGSFVLATMFNVDFADAGWLAGSGGNAFGDLAIVALAPFIVEGVVEDFSDLNGLVVREFLALASTCVGGGACPHSYEGMALITQDLARAFEGGTPSQFAQDHLQVGTQPVPEPATLSLVGIALLGLSVRRLRRNDSRSSG